MEDFVTKELLEKIEENEENRINLKNQQEFNTNFIIKFVVFINLYRFYSTFIDPEEIVVKCIENTIFSDID